MQRHALRSHCHSQTLLMQLRCACKQVVVTLRSNCLLQARGASYLAVPEKLRQPRTGAQTLPVGKHVNAALAVQTTQRLMRHQTNSRDKNKRGSRVIDCQWLAYL